MSAAILDGPGRRAMAGAWAALAPLGDGAAGRIEGWLLDDLLRAELHEAGCPVAAADAGPGILAVLLAHPSPPTEAPFAGSLLSAPETGSALRVNVFDGTRWFDSECFELLADMLIVTAGVAGLVAIVRTDRAPLGLTRASAAARRMHAAGEASGSAVGSVHDLVAGWRAGHAAGNEARAEDGQNSEAALTSPIPPGQHPWYLPRQEEPMSFSERMRDMIDKGLDASRDFAKKAGEKAKELGEKGVLKLEIAQLESRAEKLVAKLGAEVYTSMVDRNMATVSRDTAAISGILKQIEELRATIEGKEKEYTAIGGTTS